MLELSFGDSIALTGLIKTFYDKSAQIERNLSGLPYSYGLPRLLEQSAKDHNTLATGRYSTRLLTAFQLNPSQILSATTLRATGKYVARFSG